MPDTTIILYVAVELVVVLLAVSAFLLFHLNKLKKIARILKNKLLEQRALTAKLEQELTAAKALPPPDDKTFVDYLDLEIDATLDYHAELEGSGNIDLDIARDTPLDRQLCSLRYIFLLAEKEARYAGSAEQSNWEVLQAKLQQIIEMYDPPISATAAARELPDNGEVSAAVTDETAAPEVAEQSHEEQHVLLDKISVLEQENASLQTLLELAEADIASQQDQDAGQLRGKLHDLQQEMLNLQTRHIELEERYLELKSTS